MIASALAVLVAVSPLGTSAPTVTVTGTTFTTGAKAASYGYVRSTVFGVPAAAKTAGSWAVSGAVSAARPVGGGWKAGTRVKAEFIHSASLTGAYTLAVTRDGGYSVGEDIDAVRGYPLYVVVHLQQQFFDGKETRWVTIASSQGSYWEYADK